MMIGQGTLFLGRLAKNYNLINMSCMHPSMLEIQHCCIRKSAHLTSFLSTC